MIWKRPCWLLAERRGSRSLEYRSGKQDPHPQQQNGALYKMILKYLGYLEYRSGRQDPHPQAVFPEQNGAICKMILEIP